MGFISCISNEFSLFGRVLKEHSMEFQLSKEEEVILLDIARKTLVAVTKGETFHYKEEDKLTDLLKTAAACFVTYKISHNLRGCIGSIFPEIPLYKEVIRRAKDAALNDPRFPAVSGKEVDKIEIEISVLSPITPINSYEDFIVGKHGVILSKGRSRALFLPQVAPEQGWNRDQTLTHLAMKAGLSPKDWREDTHFEVFTAHVFSE